MSSDDEVDEADAEIARRLLAMTDAEIMALPDSAELAKHAKQIIDRAIRIDNARRAARRNGMVRAEAMRLLSMTSDQIRAHIGKPDASDSAIRAGRKAIRNILKRTTQ